MVFTAYFFDFLAKIIILFVEGLAKNFSLLKISHLLLVSFYLRTSEVHSIFCVFKELTTLLNNQLHISLFYCQIYNNIK